jgi:UDP-glucose 4-epimerase
VNRRLFIESADIANEDALQAIVRRHDVDGIVHLAAPPLSMSPPFADSVQVEFRSNLLGMMAVLEAARAAQVKRLTIASSIVVYRGVTKGPFREDFSLPVGADLGVEAFKKSVETLVDYYAKRTGLDVVCLRISSIYGPFYRRMVAAPSRIIHAAVRGKEGPLPHPAFPQTFADAGADFMYVEDCALGIKQVQLAPKLGHRIYNLGAGRATTPREIAVAVRRVLPDAKITLQEGTGPNHRADAFQDLGRIRSDVGFEVRHSVESAIEKYVEWLQRGNEY